LTATQTIAPIAPFAATLRPPGSKSLTNRALLLAALARGQSTLRGPLVADDSKRMVEALVELGVPMTESDGALHIDGQDGRFPHAKPTTNLFLGNAGTAFRFLTAATCLSNSECQLDGIERMRQRPIGQLVQALRNIGADIQFIATPEYPPLRVAGGGLRGGIITLPPTLSSQYISALLMVAPYCTDGLTLRFDGPVTSRPYVEMTIALMRVFGVHPMVRDDFSEVVVSQATYAACEYAIEPDASNAGYFLAAAAIIPGSKCTIEGLSRQSIQGDVGFADVLHTMGAGLVFGKDFVTIIGPPEGTKLRGIDVDLGPMPDMAQTLAVVALFAQGDTTIRNIGNLRVKETDRIAALEIELTKLGATVSVEGDDLYIEPPHANRLTPAAIDTYDDHRMAMSFAVAGLAYRGEGAGIVINDPGCVDKSFPEFFEYMEDLGRHPARPA